jgi:hypothetical protein
MNKEGEEPTLGMDEELDPDDDEKVAWLVTVERYTTYRVWAHPDADEDLVLDAFDDGENDDIVDETTMSMKAEIEE